MKKDINYYITNGLYNDPELYEQIKLYVRSYIQKNYINCNRLSTSHTYYEDIVSRGVFAFYSKDRQEKYDSKKGKYTTYCQKYMIGTVRQGYNELVLGLSDYYASKWYDVNAAVQKLIDTNQKVAIENIQKICKLSAKTIKNVLKAKSINDTISLNTLLFI